MNMTQINKILLGVSLVLNGVLLAFVVGLLPLLLYISILTILFLCWWVQRLLVEKNNIEGSIVDMSDKIERFSDHLENLYGLETYYGDEDLQNLLTHSKELINEFIDFQEVYFDVEVEDDSSEEEEATEA